MCFPRCVRRRRSQSAAEALNKVPWSRRVPRSGAGSSRSQQGRHREQLLLAGHGAGLCLRGDGTECRVRAESGSVHAPCSGSWAHLATGRAMTGWASSLVMVSNSVVCKTSSFFLMLSLAFYNTCSLASFLHLLAPFFGGFLKAGI